MKKIILFLLLLIIPFNTYALSTSSEDVILFSEDTNRVLYGKNINKRHLIASTTKIMTAVIAIESGKLDNVVKVNDSVLKSYGSNVYLSVNEKITLRDLVYALLLRSGNDSALMIEDYLGGHKEFIKKMNEKSIKIGMKNTYFKNVHGLDEESENYSTCFDMALLMKYANTLFDFREITSTKKRVVKTNYKTYSWTNKNKLLFDYRYTTGGKTGYTTKAKRTLVTSASKNDINLIVVTFNDKNDFKTHEELYEYGFNNYRKILVLNKRKIRVDNNKYKNKLYIKNNYYYLIKENEEKFIKKKAILYKSIKYKNKVGYLDIFFKNKKVHREYLYIK